MRYDLELICRLCGKLGLSARMGDQCVEVDLGRGAVLCFQMPNATKTASLDFSTRLGTRMAISSSWVLVVTTSKLDYLNLLTGLKQGWVLVCEQEVDGRRLDRWLIHSE